MIAYSLNETRVASNAARPLKVQPFHQGHIEPEVLSSEAAIHHFNFVISTEHTFPICQPPNFHARALAAGGPEHDDTNTFEKLPKGGQSCSVAEEMLAEADI